jgi:hypothetical protein
MRNWGDSCRKGSNCTLTPLPSSQVKLFKFRSSVQIIGKEPTSEKVIEPVALLLKSSLEIAVWVHH